MTSWVFGNGYIFERITNNHNLILVHSAYNCGSYSFVDKNFIGGKNPERRIRGIC